MWIETFDRMSYELFFRLWYWFLPFFGVSFLSLVFSAWKLSAHHPLRRLNAALGAYQRFLLGPRSLLLGLFVLWFAWSSSDLFLHWSWQRSLFPLTCALMWFANVFFSRRKTARQLQLLAELGQLQTVNPQSFFLALQETYGPWPVVQYLEKVQHPAEFDFRAARKVSRVCIWWKSLLATFRVTHLIALQRKHVGKQDLQSVVAALAVLWSLYVLRLSRVQLRVQGLESLTSFSKAEHRIWCFQHQSIYDFVLAPLMCYFARSADGRLAELPCFLMAKDHFSDNFFLKRVLGIGRVAEILGMIFVERKVKSAITAERAVEQAVDCLWEKRALGIFPQGTRAWPQYDVKGNVLGASFFVVGSKQRMQYPLSHLKSGVAKMVLGCLKRAQHDFSQTSVLLLPVVFAGAAKLMPRHSLSMKTGETVELRFGEACVFNQTMLRSSDQEIISDILRKLKRAFINTLNLEAELERRFFEFVGKQSDGNKHEAVLLAFKAARGKDPTLYMVLDAIYTCKAHHWPAMQAQLVENIIDVASHDELIGLYQDVVKHIGK